MKFLIALLIIGFVLIAGILFIPEFNINQEEESDSLSLERSSNPNPDGNPSDLGDSENSESSIANDYSFNGCYNQQISYAVKNLILDEECIGDCDEKKIICTFDVFNLDYETSGVFGFNVYLKNADEIIASDYKEAFIDPRGNETFINEFTIQNQEISCVYAREIIPIKEIC